MQHLRSQSTSWPPSPQRKHSSSEGFFPSPFVRRLRAFFLLFLPFSSADKGADVCNREADTVSTGAGSPAGPQRPRGRRAAPHVARLGPEGPHSGLENTPEPGRAGPHAAAPGRMPAATQHPREGAGVPSPTLAGTAGSRAAAGLTVTQLGCRPGEVGQRPRDAEDTGAGARPRSRPALTTPGLGSWPQTVSTPPVP